MRNNELFLIVILVALFVLMPLVPESLLNLFHHPAFIFIGLLVLLWLASLTPQIAILGLLMVGALYLERNRRTLLRVAGVPRMSEDAELPVSPSLRFVDYEEPRVDRHPYAPASGCASDRFEPVGSSINEKRALTTMPPGEAGVALIRSWPGIVSQ